METKQYPIKWQKHFAFFDTYGAPKTPEHKAAIKQQPYFARFLIMFNFFAYFFGPIYFAIVGLWKKALILLAISLCITMLFATIELIIGREFPRPVWTAISLGVSFMWGFTANYAYYLKKVKGLDGWNPFEGFSLY